MIFKKLSVPVAALFLTFFVLRAVLAEVEVEAAKPIPTYTNISAEQARSWKQNGRDVLFLDVREVSEFDAGHVECSVNMPWDSKVLHVQHTALPQKEIIVYCRSGRRSANASQFLIDNGHAGIYNMLGGFNAWKIMPSPTPTPTPTPTPVVFSVVKGAIIDPQTSKPVNGASVQIDGGAAQTFTNAKGKFYLCGVLPGAHQLQVWGFAYDFKNLDAGVPQDGTLDIGTISLPKIGGTVVGKLVDSHTGEPLPAATVQLDGGGRWRTLTDEQGNFMLIFVEPGEHILQAWGFAYSFQEHFINVNASGPTDVGSLAFNIIPDTVRGQIVDKNTGRPVMGAHVQFDGGGDGRQTITNINGRFILVNVPSGERRLQTWGWAYNFNEIQFTQNSGGTSDMGLVQIAPMKGTIYGRLLDAVNGLPIYNAVVQLDGGGNPTWKTYSLPNGDFIVYDVSDGAHQLQTWGYAYRFLAPPSICFSVDSKGLGDLRLLPDPNTFNGRALDAQTRLPIQGAEIILSGEGQYISTKSFPDGRFVLLNVPKGSYDITVEEAAHSLVHIRTAHPGGINVDIGDVLLP